MSKVRGIRFTDKEEAQIEEFLKKNPLLDFSTMVRLAILEFIKNPKFNLIPVKQSSVLTEDENARTI